MNTLFILTGPAGVGKSTISKLIANKLEKSCLIEGDDVYHMVIGSYQSPWKEGNHLEFSWKNCLDLIENSLNFGYDVVFNYIVKKPSLEKILSRVSHLKVRVKFVVLMTDEETLLNRDTNREESCRMGERVLTLLRNFQKEDFNEKNILNSSKLDEEQTALEILNNDRFIVFTGENEQ